MDSFDEFFTFTFTKSASAYHTRNTEYRFLIILQHFYGLFPSSPTKSKKILSIPPLNRKLYNHLAWNEHPGLVVNNCLLTQYSTKKTERKEEEENIKFPQKFICLLGNNKRTSIKQQKQNISTERNRKTAYAYNFRLIYFRTLSFHFGFYYFPGM